MCGPRRQAGVDPFNVKRKNAVGVSPTVISRGSAVVSAICASKKVCVIVLEPTRQRCALFTWSHFDLSKIL
jgi:hypothetical protein